VLIVSTSIPLIHKRFNVSKNGTDLDIIIRRDFRRMAEGEFPLSYPWA
jgi:hypothetical protein